MNSNIQLISILISFIYGILFYSLTNLLFKLINNLKVIYKHIITFIYVLDMSIIYMIILYKINLGYFHIYFIFMVFLGFIIGEFLSKYLKSKIDVNRYFKH